MAIDDMQRRAASPKLSMLVVPSENIFVADDFPVGSCLPAKFHSRLPVGTIRQAIIIAQRFIFQRAGKDLVHDRIGQLTVARQKLQNVG